MLKRLFDQLINQFSDDAADPWIHVFGVVVAIIYVLWYLFH
jgi:hypothetical protein